MISALQQALQKALANDRRIDHRLVGDVVPHGQEIRFALESSRPSDATFCLAAVLMVDTPIEAVADCEFVRSHYIVIFAG